MKKLFILCLVPLFLAISNPVFALGSRDDGDANTKEQVLKLLLKLITFRYTAILLPPEDDSSGPGLGNSDDNGDNGGFSLNPKGVIELQTAGFFNKKFKWEIRTRGLGTVTSAAIHCKNFRGQVGAVGVTLEITSFFHDNWRHAKGKFDEPDLGNDCGWEDFADVMLALELGRGYIKISTEDEPDGIVGGDLVNIGLY